MVTMETAALTSTHNTTKRLKITRAGAAKYVHAQHRTRSPRRRCHTHAQGREIFKLQRGPRPDLTVAHVR